MKPTRGIILIEDIKEEAGFTTPSQKGDLRKGKVLAVGDFLFHMCGEKIYPEPKVDDIVYFVYNGNETIPGSNQHLVYFDQLRGIVE